jgi:hypothetical protein
LIKAYVKAPANAEKLESIFAREVKAVEQEHAPGAVIPCFDFVGGSLLLLPLFWPI